MEAPTTIAGTVGFTLVLAALSVAVAWLVIFLCRLVTAPAHLYEENQKTIHSLRAMGGTQQVLMLDFDKSILGCFHLNHQPVSESTTIPQQEICIVSDCTVQEVHNCFGFLDKISTWERGKWKEAVAGPLPLNWELRGHMGLTIRPSSENPKLHVIHMHEDNIPKISTYALNIMANNVMNSGKLLRLDIAIRGEGNISGLISLRFRGTKKWSDPDVAKISTP